MKKQILNHLSNERGSAMLVMMLFMSMALSVIVTNSMSSFSDVSKEASNDTASKAAQFLASNIVKYVKNDKAFYGINTATNMALPGVNQPVAPTVTLTTPAAGTTFGMINNRISCTQVTQTLAARTYTGTTSAAGGTATNGLAITCDAITCLPGAPGVNNPPCGTKLTNYNPAISNMMGLYNTMGAKIFDPLVATNGFDNNLQPCNTFSIDVGNDACPYRPNVYWMQPTDPAKCGGNCTSKIEVHVDIVYRPLYWAHNLALAMNANKNINDTMNSYTVVRPIQ
jgi:hypothetical protein